MYDDLSRICFLFFELLLFVVCDILFVFFSKFFVYIMLVVVVVLYGRNYDMLLMYYFIGFIFIYGGCM